MSRLKKKYQQEVVPALQQALGLGNRLAVPRLIKVTVNVGIGKSLKDPKIGEVVTSTLERITAQKPVPTKAKQSISNFKVRQGQIVGYVVTLRGERMYDFVDKLISITLPRVRDFRGLDPKTVDQQGNLNLGFKEHMAFPEIQADEVEKIHGLQVTITSSPGSREAGFELFRLLGFPFRQQ